MGQSQNPVSWQCISHSGTSRYVAQRSWFHRLACRGRDRQESTSLSHAVLFGGSGFIGTHLARRLATDRGMKVTIVDLHPPATTLEGVTYVHGDVRLPIDPALDPALGPAADPALDPMADPAVREPIDLVVNLAAIHRVPGHDDHEYHDTNENGAANVTAFCEAHGVETVVFTSSISVYGPSESALSE
ncbi:MAG: NAD(P)-dependent oxidoreductase, partial [Acidimicrobiales bacterium]